jgi:hypothetical protein
MPKRARRSKRSTRTSRNDRPPPDDVEKRSTTLPRVLRYSPLDMPSTEDKGPLWGLASLEPGAGLSPASLVHPPTTPTPKGGRRPPLRRAGPRPTSRRCGARRRRSPRSVPRVPSKREFGNWTDATLTPRFHCQRPPNRGRKAGSDVLWSDFSGSSTLYQTPSSPTATLLS